MVFGAITAFSMAIRGVLRNTNGEGKATLHPGTCLAHYPQMPQKRVLAQFCQGSSVLAELAFQGEKATSPGYPELYGYFNYIHLFLADDGDRDVIPKSMQLVAGRTRQEYNVRKERKGAFGKIVTTQRL